ncbi:MAG: DnaJ domain-containing protein [Polyangiaceae bacterium]|nr:DnaJ domain-containing protein [Polyangiaceae bacterium]
MQLPGRLKTTTLGDLLGVIHRNASTGTLELAESNGRIHRVFLARGLITAVELDCASLAESREIDGRALRRRIMQRLAVLEELRDAVICFRVAVRSPRCALVNEPLSAAEFLSGRKRARDRIADNASNRRPVIPAIQFDRGRIGAYRALGLPFGACENDVKCAYRRLVRNYHPDLHPGATHDERRTLSLRFSEVTAAYRALVA